MNTVLKGNNYENECYILIQRVIDNQTLGVIPNTCRVYQKKGYYSKDRESNIIFDISIEVWPVGASNYTLLYLIECKDYEKKVPIDDVEEFYAKAIQVGGVHIKGVFISKSTFQGGAYRYARSKGMMLIQANSSITYSIILHKSARYKFKNINTNMNITPISIDNYDDPCVKDFIHYKWIRILDQKILLSFIYYLQVEINSKEKTIPKLSRSEIDQFVNELLFSYDPTISKYGHKIIWTNFKKFLLDIFDLHVILSDDLGKDDNGRQILSRCSFVDKTIEIHKSIQGTNRYVFLLAHEIGHFFLHNKISISQYSYESFSDSEYILSLDKHKINNQRGWIEWQANAFASSLILPQESLLYKLFSIQKRIGLKPGRPVYLDNQRCNVDDFYIIINELAIYFHTTKTSIIYRLKDMGFLEVSDNYSGRSVGKIIREIYPGVFN